MHPRGEGQGALCCGNRALGVPIALGSDSSALSAPSVSRHPPVRRAPCHCSRAGGHRPGIPALHPVVCLLSMALAPPGESAAPVGTERPAPGLAACCGLRGWQRGGSGPRRRRPCRLRLASRCLLRRNRRWRWLHGLRWRLGRAGLGGHERDRACSGWCGWTRRSRGGHWRKSIPAATRLAVGSNVRRRNRVLLSGYAHWQEH